MIIRANGGRNIWAHPEPTVGSLFSPTHSLSLLRVGVFFGSTLKIANGARGYGGIIGGW